MAASAEALRQRLQSRFDRQITTTTLELGEVTAEVDPQALLEVCRALRDEPDFRFEILVDLCGVDYSEYNGRPQPPARFAVVYHLLSVSANQRLRLRVFPADQDDLQLPSVTSVWASANWYEREAFDLFGFLFEGHPDLRRILTDYGFIGHPFRKDFPLIGNVEMRYDPERQRVVYEPVSIEPRILVPRVIRDDNRYQNRSAGASRG